MAGRTRDRGWPPPPDRLAVAAVDNHTHLESVEAWDADGWVPETPEVRPGLAAHLRRAAEVGVERVVQVGCDLDAIAWTDALLRRYRDLGGVQLVGAIAIHPNEAVLHAGIRELAPDGLVPDPQPRHGTALDDAIAEVARVARDNPRIRAIGETGLDFFRAGERGRAVQRESFRAHIALAKELGLPLQIHDRDAHAEVIRTLLADGAPDVTVFHCFSGDAAMARLCVANGWYLSFAGPLTFRANDAAREAAAAVPLSSLLVETDAPYLTPHPFRGRPNGPYLLPLTLAELAGCRGVTLEEVAGVTAATSELIYGPW